MLFSGGFTFSNFLADVLSVFIFVLWFWLLITVFGDLFRRHDISSWAKAIWVIALIIFPYLGIFIYLIAQHRGMAERQGQRVQQAREDMRHFVGYSSERDRGHRAETRRRRVGGVRAGACRSGRHRGAVAVPPAQPVANPGQSGGSGTDDRRGVRVRLRRRGRR